jgi:enolase-phosphatase E1
VKPPAAVVVDIEGTTTAIAFVHRTLFPFARARLEAFLAATPHDAEVEQAIAAVRAEAPGAGVAETLRAWIDADRKAGPLKLIQGRIWRQGFEAGTLKGHVYPDVAPALRAWHAGGVRLAVYSSGSEEAQRLLFGHSIAGDLGQVFGAFLDTRIGAKRETASYTAIARHLALPGENILFLSDLAEELDAAEGAGLLTCQLVRAEDGTRATDRHRTAPDFTAVARLLALPPPAAAS